MLSDRYLLLGNDYYSCSLLKLFSCQEFSKQLVAMGLKIRSKTFRENMHEGYLGYSSFQIHQHIDL